MSLHRPEIEADVSSSCPGLRPHFGFSAFYSGRLGPLALDKARKKLDPMLYSVTVAGLNQNQIDEVDFGSIFRLERIRAAFRDLSSIRR